MTRNFLAVAMAATFAFAMTACTDRSTDHDRAGRITDRDTTQKHVYNEGATSDLGRSSDIDKGTATVEQHTKTVTTKIDNDTEKERIPVVESKVKQADVNRMGEDDFVALGLSRTQAKRVIDYRKHNGDFRSLDDLARVPGFDQSWFKQHRSNLATG